MKIKDASGQVWKISLPIEGFHLGETVSGRNNYMAAMRICRKKGRKIGCLPERINKH